MSASQKKSEFSKQPTGDKILLILAYCILGLFLLAIIFPVIYIILSSFIDPITLQNKGVTFDFSKWTLTAYPMSRPDFRGKGFFNLTFMITMFFGGGLIPTYLLIVNTLDWQDNILAILVPGAFSVWNMIIVRTHYQGIPQDLQEAADIDGASEMDYFFRVLLPVCTPIIATISMWNFVGMWNSYFDAMIYLKSPSKQPLQLVLRGILIQSQPEAGMVSDIQSTAERAQLAELLKYATIIISSLPLMIMEVHMISGILREARKHEEIAAQLIPDTDRPSFHLSPRVGWMNDPNGFSYYQGKYHLFYQYYPYVAKWGPMHWGHAVSEDLLHWEHLPAALAPDTIPDKDGCFSGSAVELADGRHLLMYTGVSAGPRMPDGTRNEVQTQCIAVGDGIDYEKYDRNPVLTDADIPEGSSKVDFRDPKLWREEDGTYRCVVGNRPADGSGQILYYSSEDGFHWKFESVLAENQNRFGLMWECPDFFELDGKYVLLTSPQDMLPSGFEYHNGNGTLCLIGDFDRQSKTFREAHNQAIDYGIDFYATQTLLTPDGRRIMIAWMQNWDTLSIASLKSPWFGQMTIPRELSVKNGRLYQWPIRELDALRSGHVSYQNVEFEGELTLEGVKGSRVDVTVTVRPGDEGKIYQKFAVWFGQNDIYHTGVSFRPYESVLKIDRKFSGSRRAIIHQRRCKVPQNGGKLTFRMILDRFSAEIFVNHGEQTISATMYTDQSADGFMFRADGKVIVDIEKYDLDAEKE